MTPFARILVPLDRSSFAQRAVPLAAELARRTGTPLRLFSVATPGDEDAMGAHLAAVAAQCGTDTGVESEVVGYGSIAAAIAGAAGPGTLVCMASHGESGAARTLLGAVTQAVLRRATEPVLLVGPRVPPRPAFRQGRIVACVDGSAFAERALAPAASWSAALGLPLWLAEVAPTTDPPEDTHGEPPPSDYLEALAPTVGTHVEGWQVLHGRHPLPALAGLAEDAPVAAFVVATHGRAGWERVLGGSLAATLAHRMAVPVLVVPAGAAPPPTS